MNSEIWSSFKTELLRLKIVRPPPPLTKKKREHQVGREIDVFQTH